MAKQVKYDPNHPFAVKARNNVIDIIDFIDPPSLVNIIKNTPSVRGMVCGNIAELQFLRSVSKHPEFSDFYKPDDHNRSENKIDLRLKYKGHFVSFQLKSVQTNSIRWNIERNTLECDVQNDGSDKRKITLPNGHQIETTNYKYGDYDILAVPLFPFTRKWDFAYLLNEDCTKCSAKKYSDSDRPFLAATTEKLSYPLTGKWTNDIFTIIHELFRRKGITL